MNNDIRPYRQFELYYQMYIEPRRVELAELMAQRRGLTTKISVSTPGEHIVERSPFTNKCVCVDCVGDFSGASYDEWGGR